MIELIHGTIDADGLDYVCRDVWAGGYDSFNVNLQRLIESINIDCRHGYTLTFSSKSLNEIESVLNVKNFQFLYVINHHKVLLEQHLLVEGVKSAASYHLEEKDRETAIRQLCDYHSFWEPVKLKKGYILHHPCDDDFICLMKQTPSDPYIDQWFSRNHRFMPLWKTRIEFFYIFREIIDKLIEQNPQPEFIGKGINSLACEMLTTALDDDCLSNVCKNLSIASHQIVSIPVDPKFRQFDPQKIKIDLNDDPIDYSSLKHEGFTVVGIEAVFHFWYVESEVYYKQKDVISKEISNYLTQRLLHVSDESQTENSD